MSLVGFVWGAQAVDSLVGQILDSLTGDTKTIQQVDTKRVIADQIYQLMSNKQFEISDIRSIIGKYVPGGATSTQLNRLLHQKESEFRTIKSEYDKAQTDVVGATKKAAAAIERSGSLIARTIPEVKTGFETLLKPSKKGKDKE